MAPMSFEVRTRVFEGPLDLLLQLITSHQLEITELSLLDIVNEYLSYIDDMADFDMEVTSEFLLIAATMIQLKARHLLPERHRPIGTPGPAVDSDPPEPGAERSVSEAL